MGQKANISVVGLATNTNLQTLPDGSIVNAKNVNIDRKQAFGRRGFTKHSAKANIDALVEYQNKIIAHTTNNYLQHYTSGAWTNNSTSQTAPTGYKMKFLNAAQNLYFTTSTGVKVLDAYNGTVYNTGMPRGLSGSGTVAASGSMLGADAQVAYRVIWGSRDANSNLYLGAPSQRIIVANSTAGALDVTLTFTVPSGITTSDFFQVYRSRQSTSSTTEPDDELQLVYEANPTAGEVSALSVTFTDNTPDSLKGAYLYSNENQEGAAETNEIPPFCIDIAEFKNFTFFAGIKTKHYLDLSLLAVGGSDGLAANDTITINGMVFTAKAIPALGTEFTITTGGSAAQNVDDTARALVTTINTYASNTTIYAYYESGYADLPGKILLEERTLSGTAFTVSVSRATAWTLDNSGTSINSEYQNGIMWSKSSQPEHVPFSHLQQIGSKSYAIKRILALKDSLFILKEDGVFRLTGDNGNWSVDILDSSTFIIAPESAAVINNQIYALTNQGVAAISDIGVQVVSEDIKDSLQALIGLDYASLQTTTYGIGYETDRKYILGTILGSNTVQQQWVLNIFTNKWSRWEKDANCGFVARSVDKLYFADDTNLLEERKSFTFRDFIDEEYGTFNVSSSSGTSVVLDNVTNVTVGDLLYQSSSIYSPITAVDPATNTVTVHDTASWSAAAVTIYKGIDCELEWSPTYCDNSGYEKAFHELQLMFKEDNFLGGTIDFYTDLNGGFDEVTVNGNYGGGTWGLFGWGEVPWGGESRPKPIRVSVPRNRGRGSLLGVRFSLRMAYSEFIIEGFSLLYDFVSERQGSRNT